MEISVLNACKGSTRNTRIALQRRDYLVGETITRRATLPLYSMSIWYRQALLIPMFVSTEQAVEWGSHLNAKQHATLVKKQRALSSSALAECDPQRMVDLATQSQLMREAAEAFVPA
jgi:hypothetical protein